MQIWELSRRWKAASGVVRYPPRCDSDRDNKKTAGVVGGGESLEFRVQVSVLSLEFRVQH